MNYKFVYESIIEKAKSRTEVLKYCEKHHILPKSLGGNNDEHNLVKLTAKEHFICHWLLVKMYPKDSLERNKMLFAFWRMQSNPHNNGQRYLNSRAYEHLRIEFANAVGSLTKQTQAGELNSQYGKKWYTNRETGESHSFFKQPNEKWILGRNWFNNEGKKTFNIITQKPYTLHEQNRNKRKNQQKTDNSVITYYDGYKKCFKTISTYVYNKGSNLAKMRWNEFHSGNYSKLDDYAKLLNITRNAIHNMFAKYIPIYNKHVQIKRKFFASNKDLIDVFE